MKRIVCIVIISVLSVVFIGYGLFYFYEAYERENKNGIPIVKIGAILPLSGKVAVFGDWMKNGMNLALNEFNENYPDYKGKIEIIFEDSKFEAKTGITAMYKLKNSDNVDIFISTMSNISKPIIDANLTGNPILLQDVTYPKITEGRRNVFRHFISSDEEGKTLASEVRKAMLDSCGFLYQNDETGAGAKIFFEQGLKDNNISYESYAIEASGENKSIIAKALAKSSNCITVFAYGSPWISTIKTLKELNYKGRIFTNTAMYIKPWRDAVSGATDNITFTHPKIDENSNFSKKYKELFKEEAPIEAAYGYDLIKIITESFLKSVENKSRVVEEIYKINEFKGAFGITKIPENKDIKTTIYTSSFDKNGNLHE